MASVKTTTKTNQDTSMDNNDNIKDITMTHETLTHTINKSQSQSPKNYHQSHLYDSDVENFDEQARMIATKPSLRSHKFIIIPANKPLTTTTLAISSVAATTTTTNKQTLYLYKSILTPPNLSQYQHQQQLERQQILQISQLPQQQQQQRQKNVNETMPQTPAAYLTSMPATIPRYIHNNNKYQRQIVTPTLSLSLSSSSSLTSTSTSLSLSALSRADIIHQSNDICEMEVATRDNITTTFNIIPTATATATIASAMNANTANNMNVKFSIENSDLNNRISDATITIAITPPLDEQSLYYTTTIPAINSIYTVNNFTPLTSQIKSRIKTVSVTGTSTIFRPVSALLPSNLTLITATTTIPTTTISATLGDHLLITPGINWRTSFNERHSSMRSIVSAYINEPNQLTVNSLMRPSSSSASTSCSGLIYDKKFNSSSYLLRDNVANQIYSDVTSVRSLASIGIGSTDGKKLVIRRVPQTPNELLNVLIPITPTTTAIDTAISSSPLLLKTPLSNGVNINDYHYNKDVYDDGDYDDDVDDDDDDDDYDDYDDYYTNGYMRSTNTNRTTLNNLKPRKQKWANKMQFVLACIGYSVGLGNVWRFPYMCYKSGGGVFLIPYCIILVICSIPLLFMELSIGQYTGRGPIGAFGQLCPLFKGAGLASVVVSFLMSTYYSIIIGYSIYYFFTSFRTHLPWIDCSNRWNTPHCWIPQRLINNLTAPVTSRTPSEEFFENKVLKMSAGIEYSGTMRWELFACLLCAWLLVYFATWKSIKSSAKVRYFTATFPFVLIIILMIRAITLDGAAIGLRYFFRPNWQELKNANIWINAASQNFNSLGITFGSMISFASYNKYNNNIMRDTLAVSLVNVLTSLLVGIFAFATLGNLALEQNTNVKDVISDGPGLIFIVYPQAMVKMPYAQLWAVMFFFMLLCLGLNSQFAIIEVVVTSIQDGFPNWIKRHLGYHEIVVLIVCVISCLFGLPNVLQSGIYFFQLMDHYAASITIMFLAFCQMIAIAWLYGVDRLSKNIKQMTGKAPSFYLQSCWITFGPCLLFAIWILSLMNYKEPSYHNGRYKYPTWSYGLGWIIASLSLLCIPGYALINLLRTSKNQTLLKRLEITLHPNIYECKICGEHHCEHDIPEQEHFMLQQKLATLLYKPQIITPITLANNTVEEATTATTTLTNVNEAAATIAQKIDLNKENIITMPSTSQLYSHINANASKLQR